MPSKLKEVSVHTIVEGMDTVTAREYVKNTQASYILNCVSLSQGNGNVGVITNPKGNKLVSYNLPAGDNKCIGVATDEEVNKFYYFVCNSNRHHLILQYNALTKSLSKVLENLTDTGNVDIMNLNKDYLILHADVVRNNLLYWVDGLNEARKTNINKLFDKSITGYGTTILQSFIDAYKQTSALPPTAVYFSDLTKPFNRLYGALRKFCIRFIYDDGEKSNWSDFSSVPLPDFEPFTGINTIPTDNNGIKITFDTGDRTVKKIEIAMQSTSAEEDVLTLLKWVSIATLEKSKLNIADNSSYTYNYYNDIAPSGTSQEKIIRPYSFLPKAPVCQSFVKNALVYSNAKEGFPDVPISMLAEVTYEDLFLDPGVENEFNKPFLSSTTNDSDYSGTGVVTRYDGTQEGIGIPQAPVRFNRHTVKIGFDVKKGNNFQLYYSNGYGPDTFNISYTATLVDTAETVAYNLKQQLINTGRMYQKTKDIPYTNIYENIIDGDGNVSFSFIFRASKAKNYIAPSASVNPVQFDTLKDTGQSLRNIKMGSTIKFGIMYEDFYGRKSLTYTSDALIVGIQTINAAGGIKASKISIQISHKPPLWAKYYQIVRSNDLTYGNYIQMLIQDVVELNEDGDDEQDFLDLVVGSLFTFQRIHPNSPLRYEFAKGDRLRLIKKLSTDTLYPDFETEIISYQESTVEKIDSNLVSNGTNTVTVASASENNIGKVISVDNWERTIVGVPSSTTYLLNNIIGGTDPYTNVSYDLIDRRGTIRIRKPNGITIEDQSTVELYKPSNIVNQDRQFFEFQKKYPILNPATTVAYHSGPIQDQSDVEPAIVTVTEGTAYVRNREMPINNAFPGTQIAIQPVEDPSYSDFYPSLINDNGRINSEDTGDGEVHFGSRMRFSNNFIEDTRINGLNDFDNLDREDYNDQYGDIKLTKFDTNRIFTFKQLKSAFVPVDSRITQDNSGIALNVGSAKLLNPIQYFAWEGGIGDNPESYASNGTQKYFVSANSGVIIRFGGNGEEPISKTFSLDNEIRILLNDAINNKARIFGGFDRENALYVVTIEGYNKYIYFDGFNGWITETPVLPDTTLFEIVSPPTNGTATLSSGYEITYQPNSGYVGPDNFTYRAFVNGIWSEPRKACLTIVEGSLETGWRVKLTSNSCSVDQYGLRTGYVQWSILEEYYIFSGMPTGNEKPNSTSDPNYVAPIYDPEACVPQPVDDQPNPFTFIPVEYATVDTLYTSNVITPDGFNIPLPISVVDGEYRLNGGSWTSSAGTINPGQTLQTRRNSSPAESTPVQSTVTIASQSGVFMITTEEGTSVACGSTASYSGGEAFPSETTIILGSDLGNVVLNFDAVGVPDKFIVEFDGIEVINTGYRGDTSYQSTLDAALAARSLPPEVITSPGAGTTSFVKSTPTTTALVKVFAPISGTAWSFTLLCPNIPSGQSVYSAEVDNDSSSGPIQVVIKDNTDNQTELSKTVNQGSSSFGFLVQTDSNLMTVEITNNTTATKGISISGVGGFNAFSPSVPNGNTYIVNNVPKGNISISSMSPP